MFRPEARRRRSQHTWCRDRVYCSARVVGFWLLTPIRVCSTTSSESTLNLSDKAPCYWNSLLEPTEGDRTSLLQHGLWDIDERFEPEYEGSTDSWMTGLASAEFDAEGNLADTPVRTRKRPTDTSTLQSVSSYGTVTAFAVDTDTPNLTKQDDVSVASPTSTELRLALAAKEVTLVNAASKALSEIDEAGSLVNSSGMLSLTLSTESPDTALQVNVSAMESIAQLEASAAHANPVLIVDVAHNPGVFGDDSVAMEPVPPINILLNALAQPAVSLSGEASTAGSRRNASSLQTDVGSVLLALSTIGIRARRSTLSLVSLTRKTLVAESVFASFLVVTSGLVLAILLMCCIALLNHKSQEAKSVEATPSVKATLTSPTLGSRCLRTLAARRSTSPTASRPAAVPALAAATLSRAQQATLSRVASPSVTQTEVPVARDSSISYGAPWGERQWRYSPTLRDSLHSREARTPVLTPLILSRSSLASVLMPVVPAGTSAFPTPAASRVPSPPATSAAMAPTNRGRPGSSFPDASQRLRPVIAVQRQPGEVKAAAKDDRLAMQNRADVLPRRMPDESPPRNARLTDTTIPLLSDTTPRDEYGQPMFM